MSECPVISILLSRQDADFHAATAMTLETCLLKRPTRVILKLFGEGIPVTAALAYDDILQRKFPETIIVTSCYGRLIGADLLVWLRGDFRQMVPSGYGYIPLLEEREDEGFGGIQLKTVPLQNLARRDYGNALRRIGAFLPVKDFTGVPIDRHRFAEFGILGPRVDIGPDIPDMAL
ncbi:MAG: hypothetical protein ACOYM3_11360 [Terrimicrobiaceae bacterium]